jgi:hypothetical protein
VNEAAQGEMKRSHAGIRRVLVASQLCCHERIQIMMREKRAATEKVSWLGSPGFLGDSPHDVQRALRRNAPLLLCFKGLLSQGTQLVLLYLPLLHRPPAVSVMSGSGPSPRLMLNSSVTGGLTTPRCYVPAADCYHKENNQNWHRHQTTLIVHHSPYLLSPSQPTAAQLSLSPSPNSVAQLYTSESAKRWISNSGSPPVTNFSCTVMPAAAIMARRPLFSSLLR